MGYAKKECCAFAGGIAFLLGGSFSDFVVPLYIGLVIDALDKENFDAIGGYCLQLFLIVLVSLIHVIPSHVLVGCRSPESVLAAEPLLSTS